VWSSITEELHTVSTVRIRLLGLDESGQKLDFGFSPAEQIKDSREVGKLDVELYEAGELSLLFFGVYPCAVGFEVEQNREPECLFLFEFEFVVLEQLVRAILYERDHIRFAILLKGLGENRHQDVIIRYILGVSVRVALF